jgi:ribosomal-protein-alanine N-acetyltransferase
VRASTFSRATPADLDALAQLERTCFPQAWSREAIAAELAANGGAGLVVRDPTDGRPVAFLFYRIIDGEAHLFRVAVAPERRKRGIGTDLMTAFIRQARARGMRAAVLEVGADNAAALALYRKFGFQTVGSRRGYYDGGREDALILIFNLNEEAP